MKNKSSKIAFFAFTSQIVRVLSGPLSLVVLSSNFSSEQLSFYYTFFSLIAMQQLLEMGIGFTIKQAIAHAYSAISHTTVKNYNRNIQNYFTFSLLWFVGIALFRKNTISYFKDIATKLFKEGNLNHYMESVVQYAINHNDKDIIPLNISQYSFVEVDFEEDYFKAKQVFG